MGISPPVVVLVAICAAAAVVAVAAAMHLVYSRRSRATDPEFAERSVYSFSNEQTHYMRDVRMRNQIQAWGVSPTYEDVYAQPRSTIVRPSSRGADTAMSYG